jgi:hypothetical protein
MIKEKLRDPAGGSVQFNAGETSGPSQVCFFGMSLPFTNAGLLKLKAISLPPRNAPPAAPINIAGRTSRQLLSLVFSRRTLIAPPDSRASS